MFSFRTICASNFLFWLCEFLEDRTPQHQKSLWNLKSNFPLQKCRNMFKSHFAFVTINLLVTSSPLYATSSRNILPTQWLEGQQLLTKDCHQLDLQLCSAFGSAWGADAGAPHTEVDNAIWYQCDRWDSIKILTAATVGPKRPCICFF